MIELSPYPGLRPFTEEESIFFKGRDTHIRKIVQQLEERKIIIITGASGDGKSSLVYAGVIPAARAGFFRTQFNNWLICDFRPERSPLDNLALTLSENLKIDFKNVRDELDFGFSSLIDVYKKSDFYKDANNNDGKGANLFILADQFEEFFTNPENYSDGKASAEAYTAVNLLLETGRIALAENLPVYVVFTMRSDFISQSVVFKGLPEMIGFSQFFVPRLKRHELQMVIEDPAKLAGGKISARLTQVLINELPDGFDQLPLLQHALNRLWIEAKHGKEELDFIHLAQIGGFDRDMLEAQDQNTYDTFFNSLDNKTKTYFQNPKFTNILNLHANFLYDQAYEYVKKLNWLKEKPTREETDLILRTAFKSLTKIDNGRAVRNRVELSEIKYIINKKHVSTETVCAVLNIFRLPGSTFVKPFINEKDIESEILPTKQVLDITHEALIRNWQLLHQWGVEELGYLSDYEDLKIQLLRWIENNQKKSYLLNLGTLSYFENWFEKAKPNDFWIAKNENWALPTNEKRKKAKDVFEHIVDFLKQSKNHLEHQAASKRKLRIILFTASILAILALSGLSIWALNEKSFAQKQQQIAANQSKIALEEKEKAIIAQKTAEEQRILAMDNEKKATMAKLASDSARQEAIFARALAEEQKIIAQLETENALKQKTIAQNERVIAEEQKKIAETQRKRAISASDSAQKLSYLALAQTLAYKVKTKFDDVQLNLLVAYQAFLFNKNAGGFEFDPVIFEGLKYAAELTENESELAKSYNFSNEILATRIINKDKILILYTNGTMAELDAKHKVVKTTNLLEKNDELISSAFIINDSLLVISFDNYVNRLNDFKNEKKYTIEGHTNYIRTATYVPAYKAIITGGRDNKLSYSEFTKNKLKNIHQNNLPDKIKTIDYGKSDNEVWIGLQNGDIYTYHLGKNELVKIKSFKDVRVNTLKIMNNSNYVVAGLSNGHLVFFNKQLKTIENDLFVSYAEINSLSIAEQEDIIAIGLADNTVRIYQTNALGEKPIIISGKFEHIDDIQLSTENSIMLLDNRKKMMYYFLTPNDYAEFVKEKISRNFSTKEWNSIVGKNVPFEKTINHF